MSSNEQVLASIMEEAAAVLPVIVWTKGADGAFSGVDPNKTWAFTVAKVDGRCEGVAVHETDGTLLALTPEIAERAYRWASGT